MPTDKDHFLTRRQFLKALGITAAGSIVSPSVFFKSIHEINEYDHFDPSRSYGSYVRVIDYVEPQKDDPIVEIAINFLDRQINKTIPPGRYRKKIKFLVKYQEPTEIDPTRCCIGWVYHLKNEKRTISFSGNTQVIDNI